MGRTARLLSTVVVAAVAAGALAATGCEAPPPPEPPPPCTVGRVGIVGDSLTVGSEAWFGPVFAHRGCGVWFVNARSGRPTSEGVAQIEAIASAGWMPDVLVVALGTNDTIDPRTFGPRIDRVMAVAGDRPVVWVNIDKPLVELTLNMALAFAELRYPNLHVYDWNAFVDAHPQIRQADGIHLTEGGYLLRAALIAREVTVGR